MIQETKTSVVYVGDGRQRSFPFPYRYYDAKDVVGYVENKGKWERITGNYEYHDGEKSYEYPTTGAPLAKGVKLKLARETKQSQEYDFAEDHVEKALDKITMILQEINRDGLVQVGVGDFDGVIPAGRPFAFLQYNADASGFNVVDLPDFAGEKKVLLAIRDRAESAADRAEAAAKRAGEQVAAGAEALNNSLATIAGAVSGGVARIETQTRQALNDVNTAAQTAEDKTKNAVQATQDAAVQAQKEIAAAQAAAESAKKEIADIQTDVQNNIAQKQNEFNTRSNEILDKVGGLEETVKRGEDAVASLQKYDGLEAAVKQAKAAYDRSVSRLERSMSDAVSRTEELTQIETATKADAQAAEKARTEAQTAASTASNAATKAGQSETAAKSAQTAAESARTEAQTAQTAAQEAHKNAETAAQTASGAAASAGQSAGAASASATQAKQSESAAATSATEAKNAAKQAEQIAGGDFLTAAKAETMFADKSGTATALKSKANATNVYTKTQANEKFLQKTDKIDAYTKTEAAEMFATKEEVKTKAKATDVYTKTQADERYLQKTDKIDAYTKAETDTTFATKKEVGTKANAVDVYTKADADTTFQPKGDYLIKGDAYMKAESDAKYQLKGTYASVEYVDGRVANIVNSAPETLDTLQELAEALGNDPNFATTVAKEIGTKADKATTENALKGKANAADVYTKTESNERYQLKGGASVETLYQWLKERNYNMDNFRGLESIFPVVQLSPIKVDVIEEDATEMTGTASPNVKIIFKGKTAISDSNGLWRLPAVPDSNATEVTIQWVDYAGRTHTEKIPVIFKKYCIPNGIQIVTQSIAEKYELNKPENLEFPASVTQIEERALYNYAQITGAAAPNCEYVGTKAFCGCSQLKSVSLPACITLANDAFFQCSNLTEISLPECTKIASWAFHGCIRLVAVSIPKCADMDNFVFDECRSLRTVILSENWVPTGGVKIPTTATVYNANRTKKVNWDTMSWVRVY